jgi:16S rRNA (cytosine1402-N4)-methyltransferase
MSGSVHKSVMVGEVLQSLEADKGGMFLDCTFGGGGHTRAILEANAENQVTAIDRDIRAVERGAPDVAKYAPRLRLIHGSFSQLPKLLAGASFDGILADLGLSTDQIREGRGFSFNDQNSLDMRMNEEDPLTAKDLVNTVGEQELFVLLKEGGVGAKAREIARAIIRARPIENAKALSAAINKIPQGKGTTNPSTVVFQAIRISINKELEEIETLMAKVPGFVKSGGRVSIITFHSLEDKAVTKVMRSWEGADDLPALWPGRHETKKLGHAVTKKPLTPSEEEVAENPSARSARLRVFKFQ